MFQCPYCLAAFGNLEMCDEHIKKCKDRPKQEEQPEQATEEPQEEQEQTQEKPSKKKR